MKSSKCKWCGNEFVARKTTTEYCSHRCSGLAYKERKRQAKLQEFKAEYSTRLEGKVEIESWSFFPRHRYADCSESVVPQSTDTLPTTLSQPCSSKARHWYGGRILTYYLRKVISISNAKSRDENPSLSSILQRRCRRNTVCPIRECIRLPSARDWPKTQSRGKTLWSRSHVDRYFANQQPKEEISEWYTVADIQAKYGMTLSAIYPLVSKEGIPKKKQGNYVMYSKYHFDLAKGQVAPKEPEYYTYPEAMAKYNPDPRPASPLYLRALSL